MPAVVALWRQQQGLCQPAALSAAVDLFQRPATYGPVSSSGLLPFCFFCNRQMGVRQAAPWGFMLNLLHADYYMRKWLIVFLIRIIAKALTLGSCFSWHYQVVICTASQVVSFLCVDNLSPDFLRGCLLYHIISFHQSVVHRQLVDWHHLFSALSVYEGLLFAPF